MIDARPTRTRTRDLVGRGVGPWLVLALLAGCSLPAAGPEEPAGDPSRAPLGSSVPDPTRDVLIGEVQRLRATVTASRDALAAALDSDGTQGARTAADDALNVLVAERGEASEPRPLFPADTLDRDGDVDAPDQLTITLTAARDLGGQLGNAVVDLLRDPVAGDLGAWQRDAAGVLASVTATTREADDLTGLEAAISELPGLGTQAVAWAELTASAGSIEDARAYAERGVASLEVILVSLDLLGIDGEAEATDGGDG